MEPKWELETRFARIICIRVIHHSGHKCIECSSINMAAADTASEYDSCGHRRCWTAAASCPYYPCQRRAEPVGLVLPCVYCSRTRCCTLRFVDDDGRALFFARWFYCIFQVISATAAFKQFQQQQQRNSKLFCFFFSNFS